MESFSAQSVIGVEDKIGLALEHGNRGLQFLGYFVNNRDQRVKSQELCELTLRGKYGQQVLDPIQARD